MSPIKLLSLGFCSILALACGAPGSVEGGDGDGDGDGGGDGDGDGDGDGEFPEACSKIDLVFSVDPSGSMDEEMMSMSSVVFPAFADALLAVGDGLDDYRVGVIDGCPSPANFHTRGETSVDCGFQSGAAWMTSASTALKSEFECVGEIYRESDCYPDGPSNQDEQVLRAAITSLGGPNPGFLRDDALLVVVAITDEDECPTYPDCNDTGDGQAETLYSSLVATKGDVKRVVLLAIGGGPGGCEDGEYGSAKHAVLLEKVADRFIAADRGVYWDLCEGKLEAGLTEAIAVIDNACRELPQVD